MRWEHILEWLVQSPQLRLVAHGTREALAFGIVFYFTIYLLERASGATTQQYRSRGFMQDVVYWFYYVSGLNQLLFMAALFSFLGTRLAILHLKMVDSLPSIVRGTLWILLSDFTTYWVHRLQHASRFVWAFHSTHHSQEQLNFATTTRFHPVDHFISDTLKFIPQMTLGASPMSWLPLYLIMDFISISQHSRIKWRFGPLSRVLVTPRFHSFHHSADPRHYNKNFGGLLSIWDHIFGTAVDAPEQPTEYGLRDIKMPTLLSTLLVPFALLRRIYLQASSGSDNVSGAVVISEPADDPPRG
jgi:sterol desaturase/sphingolipid hydroxylase (fatty acid hydroxylase superfamily)